MVNSKKETGEMGTRGTKNVVNCHEGVVTCCDVTFYDEVCRMDKTTERSVKLL